jgi:hypothetical protein
MANKQYRIRKSTYFDDHGNEKHEHEYHYVQQLKSFLGIKYWSSIKHDGFGPRGLTTKITTTFDTYFDAYEFVIKLKTGTKVNERKDETVIEL